MVMWENVLLCAVLFFALYGIMGLIRRLGVLVLRPERPLTTFSVAYVREEDENAEQIIRYFRARADREEVLLLVDNGVSPEQKRVIGKLCEERCDVRFLSEENFTAENCNYRSDDI